MLNSFIILAPLLLAPTVAGIPFLSERGADGGKCKTKITETIYVPTTIYVTASSLPTTEQYSPKTSSTVPPVVPSAITVTSTPVVITPTSTPVLQQPPVVGLPQGGTYKNVLYFTNWGIYGANYQPQQLPVDQVTHLLFSFADIAPDGEVKSSDTYSDLEKHYPTDSWNDAGKNAYGCVKQLYIHKKKNRNLKVLLSIGGWTYSPKFPPVAATEAGRQRFASSAVKLVSDWGFDGIDIDWEYPKNAKEAADFVALLKACRQALDDYAAQHAPGYHFIITVASPAGAQNYDIMDMEGMDPLVDSWHLMAYDYAGSWDSTSGHQANIFMNPSLSTSTKFSTEQAVGDYLKRGIRADKIMMGLPLYGRSFMRTNGIGQPYNGLGAGSIESGVWLYRDLPRPGATEMWDDVADAAYSYDPSTQELVSYDTVRSATVKAQYLLSKGLGGAVFWEASGDRSGDQSLIGVLAKNMRTLDGTPNLLSYPVSQYDNIRNGMPGI